MNPKGMQTYVKFASIGMAKTILVAGAFLIGQWLDKKYSSQPLFTLVFVLAAIILGIVWLIHLVNSSQD